MKQPLFVAAIVLSFFLAFSGLSHGMAMPEFVYATVFEGREILTSRDTFIKQLSPFDRSSRMKTDRAISEEAFLDFVGKNVLSWGNEEEVKVRSVISTLRPKLQRFLSLLPDKIYLIKTTGEEEGNAAYTRGNAIIFPEAQLGGDTLTLYKLFAHELFHIISRQNKELQDELYAVIGFKKCPPFKFPETLRKRRITNPDAPINDHCILVQDGEKKLWVVPILYSSSTAYDSESGKNFFSYLQFAFLAVAEDMGPGRKPMMMPMDNPTLYSEDELGNFYEQIGKNTDYTLHPEEVLADNFSYLFIGMTEFPSPEVIASMTEVLRKYGKSK